MHPPPGGAGVDGGAHWERKDREASSRDRQQDSSACPNPSASASATCSTPALGALSGRRPRHKAERASWRPGYSSSGPGASADSCCAGGWVRCLWSSPLAWKLPTGVVTLGPPCPPLELRGPGGSTQPCWPRGRRARWRGGLLLGSCPLSVPQSIPLPLQLGRDSRPQLSRRTGPEVTVGSPQFGVSFTQSIGLGQGSFPSLPRNQNPKGNPKGFHKAKCNHWEGCPGQGDDGSPTF